MSKVYQSVRAVVQGTIQRRTPDTKVSARAAGNEDTLSDAVEECNRIFVDGIRRLKAALSDERAAAVSKTKHAEEVIEGLKANITLLEAKVRETEDTVHNQTVDSQKMEESLRTEIGDLQRAVKEREEALKGRETEVDDLRSKIDVMAEKLSQSELAIEQARREAASKAQEAEQVIEGLKANITGLETRLKETEDTVDRKDAVIENVEKNLSAEIRNLQSVVTNKDQALETRETEVNDLRSKIDVLAEQIGQSELAVRKARKEAASKVQEAEQVSEGLKANIIVLEATLKAQLTEAEQIVGSTDSSMKELDQDRDTPAIDLNGHLQPERNGTEAMAQAFANLQAQAMSRIVAGEQGKTVEEKSSTFQAARVAPIVTESARETMAPEVFVRLIAEFSKFANVMDTIASLIVRDHVRAFGESMEKFPQRRLPELLESLSNEIPNDKLKADFRERLGSVNLG